MNNWSNCWLHLLETKYIYIYSNKIAHIKLKVIGILQIDGLLHDKDHNYPATRL